VWQYGPDEWADSRGSVDENIEKAIRKLAEEGIYRTNTIRKKGDTPLAMTVSVESLD
jgi:hypothetical protein